MDWTVDLEYCTLVLCMCGLIDCHVCCAELWELFLSSVALTVISKLIAIYCG